MKKKRKKRNFPRHCGSLSLSLIFFLFLSAATKNQRRRFFFFCVAGRLQSSVESSRWGDSYLGESFGFRRAPRRAQGEKGNAKAIRTKGGARPMFVWLRRQA
ncbi:hypothetical protein KP509_18G003300 [Ceratopteris richardii]|uniref:Uncharacterized protein n=1 Tax=Ceratopteris richardii TaxID=49495 RepID=A0A8T2SM95_CERRI|nr:hypothetical protein KP509_18G003300 [Ceratopteris richardii]